MNNYEELANQVEKSEKYEIAKVDSYANEEQKGNLVPTANEKLTAELVIDKQRQRDLETISRKDDFAKLSEQINERAVGVKLRADALEVLDEEQKNKLREYALKKEMEALDYRARHERKIERASIAAELYQKKLKAAQERYGYLYKLEEVVTIDENGEEKKSIKYKNFTISKFINRMKELTNFYRNLSDEVRHIIGITLKTTVIIGLIAAGGFAIWALIKWLINSGVLNVAIG